MGIKSTININIEMSGKDVIAYIPGYKPIEFKVYSGEMTSNNILTHLYEKIQKIGYNKKSEEIKQLLNL